MSMTYEEFHEKAKRITRSFVACEAAGDNREAEFFRSCLKALFKSNPEFMVRYAALTLNKEAMQ